MLIRKMDYKPELNLFDEAIQMTIYLQIISDLFTVMKIITEMIV